MKKPKSAGLYMAHTERNACVTPNKGLRVFLNAGYTVTPLRSYLSNVYRTTDNPTLKALIAFHYPECTGYAQESMFEPE